MVISREADGSMGEHTGLVDRAHDARLKVHLSTMRAENPFLYTDFRSSADPTGPAAGCATGPAG